MVACGWFLATAGLEREADDRRDEQVTPMPTNSE